MDKQDELKDIRENKFLLRLTGMIISGILGVITLIGIFFGRTSLVILGSVVLIILIVIILFTVMVSER